MRQDRLGHVAHIRIVVDDENGSLTHSGQTVGGVLQNVDLSSVVGVARNCAARRELNRRRRRELHGSASSFAVQP